MSIQSLFIEKPPATVSKMLAAMMTMIPLLVAAADFANKIVISFMNR